MSPTSTFKINAITFGLDLKVLEVIVVMSVPIWKEILSVMVESEMVKHLKLLEKTLNLSCLYSLLNPNKSLRFRF